MTADLFEPTPERRQLIDQGKMTLLGHDLRAAVSDVIGGLRLIDLVQLNDETRLQIERVRASGEVLARLLEEGLSLMLGEDDFVATHPANLQMARFLYDLEMRWSGRAKESGLNFEISTAADVPAVLTLDRVALDRVLANIISNAIKYTDAGIVRLDIRMDESGALRFTVTDQGPGFSQDALHRLFQLHGRPKSAVKPGQGIGMHIAKNLTGMLGGDVSVENLEFGGARVTLILPPETWTIATPETVLCLPDLSDTKVLVAEDNETNQIILGRMLTRMGAQFETANDGVEAVQWLRREKFDLALIDIEMPNMTGIEVIRTMRTDSAVHRDIPIMAITAYVLRANRDAIYSAGADAILAKPFAGLESFGQSIADVIQRRSHASVGYSPSIDEKSEINRESFDRLMEIAGPEASRELLDRLYQDLRKTEHGLITGLSASDAATVRAETHVLIALAGAVGATRLHRLAQTLNDAAHRQDRASFAETGAEALAQLDRVIHFVTQERSALGDIG